MAIGISKQDFINALRSAGPKTVKDPSELPQIEKDVLQLLGQFLTSLSFEGPEFTINKFGLEDSIYLCEAIMDAISPGYGWATNNDEYWLVPAFYSVLALNGHVNLTRAFIYVKSFRGMLKSNNELNKIYDEMLKVQKKRAENSGELSFMIKLFSAIGAACGGGIGYFLTWAFDAEKQIIFILLLLFGIFSWISSTIKLKKDMFALNFFE